MEHGGEVTLTPGPLPPLPILPPPPPNWVPKVHFDLKAGNGKWRRWQEFTSASDSTTVFVGSQHAAYPTLRKQETW